MQLTRTDDVVCVSLSRRNLEGLLAQTSADPFADPQLMRRVETGELLIVTVERDEEHYHKDGRDGRAGTSGPDQPARFIPAFVEDCDCEDCTCST